MTENKICLIIQLINISMLQVNKNPKSRACIPKLAYSGPQISQIFNNICPKMQIKIKSASFSESASLFCSVSSASIKSKGVD